MPMHLVLGAGYLARDWVFEELDTLDKGRGLTVCSSFRSINAKTDPGDTRRFSHVEVAFKASIEIKLGHRHPTRLRLAQTNKAATSVKVTAFVRKINLIVLAKKKADEIGAVRYQDVTARDPFPTEENVNHQGFVVYLLLIRNIFRIFSYAPIDFNCLNPVKAHGIIQN